MLQIDYIGITLTLLLFNPRYFLATLLGVTCLEGVRILVVWMSGGMLTKVVLGGIFGRTLAVFSNLTWLQGVALLSGPCLLLLPLLMSRGKDWPRILFSWQKVPYPYRIIFFRLAIWNIFLFFLWR